PYTVLIYPLVLKDKVWLVWAAKGGVVNSVQLPIQERQLGEAVLQFRQLVQDPTESLQRTQAGGKVLYDWLIKPLEAELKANKIQHLVFSLDRVTRYIPLAALFDGNQYLIENYTISTVLSADLTNLRDRLPPPQNTSVLAVGASEFTELSPLPSVPAELDAIVRQAPSDRTGIYPGMELLNQAFNFRALRDNLLGHRILHIATHGAFLPGRPEDSYLVLGNNEKLTISAVRTLPDLGNVHLVVLSACETALGGADQDGTEISGISYYFLNSGAAAVLASLWSVDDASTSLLMQQFYSYLAMGTVQEPVTKAEALRQAQFSLLYGRASVKPSRADLGNQLTAGQPPIANHQSRFAHPYYWAPFVLIGNGL
ncbi:CHAT domain-containing protein, partial [Pantanalinema sp. GBBB05]|uniref:CHAT domain-containing protein n=1 Tax=Pantanalinema sp. GBBB05 TaxID=2604139 RepID=UPI001DC835B6|nr:CHAT domain-containing protein [Pantanalinema sp. GBBB05]